MSKEKNITALNNDDAIGVGVDENDLPPSTSEKERHKLVKIQSPLVKNADPKESKSPQRKISDPKIRKLSPKGSTLPAPASKIVKSPDTKNEATMATKPVGPTIIPSSNAATNPPKRPSQFEIETQIRQKAVIPQNNPELINQTTSTKERASELRRKFSKCLINNDDRPYKPPKEYLTQSPKCKEEEQEFQRMAELRQEADQFATSSETSSNISDKQKRSKSETVLSTRRTGTLRLANKIKKAIQKTINDVTVTNSKESLSSKRGRRQTKQAPPSS